MDSVDLENLFFRDDAYALDTPGGRNILGSHKKDPWWSRPSSHPSTLPLHPHLQDIYADPNVMRPVWGADTRRIGVITIYGHRSRRDEASWIG